MNRLVKNQGMGFHWINEVRFRRVPNGTSVYSQA